MNEDPDERHDAVLERVRELLEAAGALRAANEPSDWQRAALASGLARRPAPPERGRP